MNRSHDRFISASTALVLSLTGCDAGAPARVEAPADTTSAVPIEWAGAGDAALIVPVHLNGTGPFRFVLDTGATFTCVDEQVADSLDLPDATGQRGFGAGVGGAGQLRLVQIDSLRVGDSRAEELPACVLDLSSMEQVGIEVHGLIGLNFLRAFRVVLDFEEGTVGLHQP